MTSLHDARTRVVPYNPTHTVFHYRDSVMFKGIKKLFNKTVEAVSGAFTQPDIDILKREWEDIQQFFTEENAMLNTVRRGSIMFYCEIESSVKMYREK